MSLKIAVITDLHYSSSPLAHISYRKGELANEFLLKTIDIINNTIKPDITVVLGDLLNDGNKDDALDLLKTLKQSINTLDSKVIVLRGNHDPVQEEFTKIMGDLVDFVDINGVRLIPFADKDEAGANASRSEYDIDRMCRLSSDFSGQIVFLQHVPLFPKELITGFYNYTNADKLLYEIARLPNPTLTLAGHEHAGMKMVKSGKDSFVAAPGLCEEPFQFMVVEIDKNNIQCINKHL